GSITVSDAISRSSTTNLNLTAAASKNIAFAGPGSLDSAGGNVNLSLTTGLFGAIISGGAATDITSGAGNISLLAGVGGIGALNNSLVLSTSGTLTSSSTGDEFLQTGGTVSIASLNVGSGTIHLTGGTFNLSGSNQINAG